MIDRTDAIDLLNLYGEEFIADYLEIYAHGVDCPQFCALADSMTDHFLSARRMMIRDYNSSEQHQITKEELCQWMLLRSSSIELLFDEEKQRARYQQIIDEIMKHYEIKHLGPVLLKVMSDGTYEIPKSNGWDTCEFAYPAIFQREVTGTYFISFPDFPNLLNDADTIPEATKAAQWLLYWGISDHLSDDEKGPLPPPSRIQDIKLEDGAFDIAPNAESFVSYVYIKMRKTGGLHYAEAWRNGKKL